MLVCKQTPRKNVQLVNRPSENTASNKLRHLWWPNLCQTMLTQSLLTKPFSKQVRRHAVLVYSFIFLAPLQLTTKQFGFIN